MSVIKDALQKVEKIRKQQHKKSLQENEHQQKISAEKQFVEIRENSFKDLIIYIVIGLISLVIIVELVLIILKFTSMGS